MIVHLLRFEKDACIKNYIMKKKKILKSGKAFENSTKATAALTKVMMYSPQLH